MSTRSYIPSQVLTNNPTKIADLFTKLFDVEWADAFEQVCRNRIGVPEVKIIVDLADILKASKAYVKKIFLTVKCIHHLLFIPGL